MLERERKFLYKEPYTPASYIAPVQYIIQGYLMLKDNKQLRVRITESSSGKKSYLTFKQTVNETDRNEYEYEIPMEDAIELMNSTSVKVIKYRRQTSFNGNHVDIDEYAGSNLKVVEIEYTNDLTELPSYCGEEITGKKEYSNIQLALNNSKSVTTV